MNCRSFIKVKEQLYDKTLRDVFVNINNIEYVTPGNNGCSIIYIADNKIVVNEPFDSIANRIKQP